MPVDSEPAAKPVVREAVEVAVGPLGLLRLDERMFDVWGVVFVVVLEIPALFVTVYEFVGIEFWVVVAGFVVARLLVFGAVLLAGVVAEDAWVPTTGVLVVEAGVCFLPVLIMLEISIVISLPEWVRGDFGALFLFFKRNYLNIY